MRLRLPFLLALLVCCGASACAAPVLAVPPDVTYVQAVQHRMGGDAQGYYNSLLALAQEQPLTRAGRRARATLRGTDWLAQGLALAMVGGALAPAVTGGPLPDPRQSHVKRQLRGLAELQQRYFADHGQYCRTFADCGVKDIADSSYLYFLTFDEVLGEPPAEVRKAARFVLERHHVHPRVEASGFVAAAVGNIDDDEGLDVWAIDELMRLVHVSNDL